MTETIKHYTIDGLTENQAQRMLDNIMNPQRNNKNTTVIIRDAEEKEIPAALPVIRMALINDQLHLTVCKEDERDGSFIQTPIQQLAVDVHGFLNALQTLVNNEGNYEFSYLMHPLI